MSRGVKGSVGLAWLVAQKLRLWVWCEGCSHHVSLGVTPLLARYGDLPLDRLRRKFTCSKCGGREIFLRPDWHGSGRSHGVVSRHEKL